MIETLVERRLLVADEETYEFVHEALLDQWPRLAGWLEEDAEGRRVRRQLTDAAVRWDADGRDASELYRGARLAAALDWSESEGAGLNRLERQFLDESRAASVRANRRLRALLAAALVLLVLAVIAGAVALQARGKARQQATAAVAERLGAQALVEPQIDRALLLARAGVELDDTTATRSNLLAALLRAPAALAVSTATMTRSSTKRCRTTAGCSSCAATAATSRSSTREHCARSVDPSRPTGSSTIAVPSSGRCERWRSAPTAEPSRSETSTATVRRSTSSTQERISRARSQVSGAGATDDVAYAPDGRTLVTGQTTSCASSPPPEQLVLRRAV